MRKIIRDKLINLNQIFYRDHARSFSATRGRIQPGVRKIASLIENKWHILDIGCGNGNFLNHLIKIGFLGVYSGIDFSHQLIEQAKILNGLNKNSIHTFSQTDVTNPNWINNITEYSYDMVTAFAVFHHIPDYTLHLKIIKQIYRCLNKDGWFIFSYWQFDKSSKLLQRILPWETIGLSDRDVDKNDFLLDWRASQNKDEPGVRYVHLFTKEEIDLLRNKTHFVCSESFSSDGKEGNLANYQIWKKTD